MSGPGPSGKRRRQHEEEHEGGHENAERWLLSYADMITLLMALFIVLFAISQVDQQKLLALSSGLQEDFGAPAITNHTQGLLDGTSVDSAIQAIAPVAPQVASDIVTEPTNGAKGGSGSKDGDNTARDQLADVRAKLVKALTAKGLQNAVHFEVRDDGLVVDIVSDRVLFDAGEATLRPEGRKVLSAVAPTLRGLDNQLTVEGHTDDVPAGGVYRSNWELSTARATTVLQYLLAQRVRGSHLSAAGYADQRPLASNDTSAGRARNRRVAVVVHSTDPSASVAASISSASTPSTQSASPSGGTR
ncbi:OmpA/MotB family protein [Phycicoccus sonneratiae]|uniref:Flagellar motor protein MotB n=1 Tax=Phycicoccus sonneratiae TaxID=2807628 RepID=A0ABS2CNN4_9MICO|nr:flagellar motor protein MotB [Phycicoccus sonneraticus]MBM6401453.1 flagellar motor protein MotB [Phycicoccus sonneraticus]